MKLELSQEEVQALLQFIDLGVKQIGLPAVNGAFVLQQKLKQAMVEGGKADETQSG